MPKGDFQPTPQNGDAGAIVQEFRESLGLSQAEFGNYISTVQSTIPTQKQGTISDWEAGKTTVPGPLVVMAMDQLGLDKVAEILRRRRMQLHVVGTRNLTVPYLPIAA